MKYFIFRNNTIEFFFDSKQCGFSGYDDISYIPSDCDSYIWFYQVPYGIKTKSSVEIIKSIKEKFALIYSQIPNDKQIIVFTLVDIYSTIIESGDFARQIAIQEFNNYIFDLAFKKENIKIIDFSDFTNKYNRNELIDWKYFFTSQLAFNAKLANDFKNWFSNEENEIALKRKKCIVLDLDNTLWGGVLGEDGIEGIKIGGDYPGKAFLYFQKSLLELEKSGVILTVCSKNNESDVKECWKQNPYNLINEKNLSSYRINWNNKADNIREIAKELNIGLDSFVFIDDNPTERELVKKELPMVKVPDFPEQPYLLPSFIDEVVSKYFRVYKLTVEDKNKTLEYKANAQRNLEQSKFTDMNSFIKSLEINITIEPLNKFNISRIAQMTQKTNQFNLTTKRYTESDITELANNGAKIWCLSVSDRFGDSGITGCIIIKNDYIDELLLSCRILGRGIEKEFIKQILSMLKKRGLKNINATYIPTAKNILVENFYDENGFKLIKKESSGEKIYKVSLLNYTLQENSSYKVKVLEE